MTDAGRAVRGAKIDIGKNKKLTTNRGEGFDITGEARGDGDQSRLFAHDGDGGCCHHEPGNDDSVVSTNPPH